jgi:hypothetical protein
VIEFTDEQIYRAASAMKAIRLAGSPGMDGVAIKLNMGATREELEYARMWALALGLATRSDFPRAMDIATEIARRHQL